MTDTELNQLYPNGILPSTPPGDSDRDNGILKKSKVDSIILNLTGLKVIPEMTNNITYEQLLAKQNVLLNNIQNEYNFYYSRYTKALTNLFNSIKAGNTSNTQVNQDRINSNLQIVNNLNIKLNDLIQIVNGITVVMLSSTSGLEESIKNFDNQNNERRKKLQAQHKIITSSQATTELNKRMVKYTEEKAKYSNNLLGLYSFLNIVAVGLLVYVYKSSNE